MKQVITIQHCQSVHHTNGMVGSWTDWDLTELGRRQAQSIADHLAPELAGQSVKLFSSDLKRAAQTAAPLAEKLGVEVEYRPELRERNLGEAVGKSAAWYREHRCPERPGDYIDIRPFPSAETVREVYQRLEPLCREVLERPEDTVVLVSHGGTLGVWNILWLGLPPETMDHCGIRGRAGAVGCFDVYGEWSRRITKIGDLSYIRLPARS